MVSLKQRTVSGFKWQLANKVLQKVISVITFAILARILEPSTFGLFALAFIAIDGFQVLKSFGLDSALVQRKEGVEEAAHTAFFIIQTSGIIMFFISFLIAPLAARFFHNAAVESVIRALGFVFIFNCFARVPSALLMKQMRFKLISIIDLISSIMNCVFAVLLSFFTRSVWSLVGAYLIKQITLAVLTRFYSGYKLKWHFNPRIAKELFGYGKFMVGLGVLWYI